jgi:hypothetical protein
MGPGGPLSTIHLAPGACKAMAPRGRDPLHWAGPAPDAGREGAGIR